MHPFTCNDLHFNRRIYFRSSKADFIHTIRGFLDPKHTLFIHANILR